MRHGRRRRALTTHALGASRERTSVAANAWRFLYSVGERFPWFEINDSEMVDQTVASWNRVVMWLRQLEQLRRPA